MWAKLSCMCTFVKQPLHSKWVHVGPYNTATRVHVPNNQVFGFWAIEIIVQVLGKYMIITDLDP